MLSAANNYMEIESNSNLTVPTDMRYFPKLTCTNLPTNCFQKTGPNFNITRPETVKLRIRDCPVEKKTNHREIIILFFPLFSEMHIYNFILYEETDSFQKLILQ